ncbi:MAG TPA: diguanylate cyclase [Noviherbaspirillum sp.]|nr:diguanylate cyclase [Noviherbaspirillum sp.]
MSLKARALLFATFIGMLIVAATSMVLWSDYRRTKVQSEQTASDITRIVEKHIFDTVTQVDVLLGEVAKSIVRDGGPQRMPERDRWEQLGAFCRSLIGCTLMGVVDANGEAVAVSSIEGKPNINVADRKYFQMSRQTGKRYIDAAIVSRLPGNPIVFTIAKPVFDASGKFLAVVSVGMGTEHFTSFYKLMGFTLNPTVTVFKGNGDIVARNPDMQVHVGKSNADGPLFRIHLRKAQSGVYNSVSVLDGRTRIAAYKSIPELDLVVFAGIENSTALLHWKERTHITLYVVAALMALVFFMIAYTYRNLVSQLDLIAHNKALDELSRMDALTGIANRRRFDEALKAGWARHLRTKEPLSLLMIDIDFFKQYNDEYGHPAGDECLRKVAGVVQSCLHRKTDLAARYGGEELAVILECDEHGALTVATRMRMEVEALAVDTACTKVSCHVTVSIGLASTSTVNAASLEELMVAADMALYEAKVSGRNRVCSAAGSSAALNAATSS